MSFRKSSIISVLLFPALLAVAKDKKKTPLPADVLQAHTVLVIIDPDAGMSLSAPNANRIARADVENALMKWGRLSLVVDATNADLIMVVRKGNDKVAQPTIGGTADNTRPVILQSTDSGGRIGARQGNSGTAGDPSDPQSSDPHPQLEIGQTQDVFAVYRGSKDDLHRVPLDSPAVWRYSAKNALESPDVPAVEVFRKLVADTEKQLATP